MCSIKSKMWEGEEVCFHSVIYNNYPESSSKGLIPLKNNYRAYLCNTFYLSKHFLKHHFL